MLREACGILLRVLYPACPHLTHALWQDLGYAAELGDLLDAPWPQVEEAALLQDEIELMLQVNGKLRGTIRVPAAADRAADRGGRACQPRLRALRRGARHQARDRRAGTARQRGRVMASVASRRRRLVLGVPAAIVLAGCGFELRRAPEMRFQRVQLSGFGPKSPLAQELRQSIDASPDTRVVDGVAQAQVVLEALADSRERSVVAYTSTGLVREVQLRARLSFRLRTAEWQGADRADRDRAVARTQLQRRHRAGQAVRRGVPVQGDAERHRRAGDPPPRRGARALK